MRILVMAKSKYGNKPVIVDNIRFASKREAAHYETLKICLKTGWISDLVLQPEFMLHPGFVDYSGKKHRPIYYIADFQYFDTVMGKTVIEDAKGICTAVYNLKKKLFLWIIPKNTIFKEV